MILQAVARSGSRSEGAVPSRSSDGGSSRAALLAEQLKAAFEAPRIENLDQELLDVLVRRVPARVPEYCDWVLYGWPRSN
jgi:hypothetical protein